MSFPESCLAAAARLLDACRARGIRLATAESCTGGLVAGCLTEHPGASAVLDRGWVVYDNRAKIELLGVRPETLASYGAVSEACARELVAGALARSSCGLALAATGIAGPGGGTPEKPVGLVHLAAGRRDGVVVHRRCLFPGDRRAIRLAAVETLLLLGLEALATEARPGAAAGG
ncbi:MAG: CinA family protein [Geminicoccaceae bacterium]|nr:CinA family protein [Geminicoccaceae bacterium]MCX7631481.1 CinA family protein [Geminicoccaceae bacterium]MDW8125027.1 CinA family protein [Geminicoccaceae bacterium]